MFRKSDQSLTRSFNKSRATTKRPRTEELGSFGFIGFSRAGHFLMACSPKRMLLAPVLVGIALGRNIFPRRALALFIRIWISAHNLLSHPSRLCLIVVAGCLTNNASPWQVPQETVVTSAPLGQQQIATISDRDLRRFGKALQ